MALIVVGLIIWVQRSRNKGLIENKETLIIADCGFSIAELIENKELTMRRTNKISIFIQNEDNPEITNPKSEININKTK